MSEQMRVRASTLAQERCLRGAVDNPTALRPADSVQEKAHYDLFLTLQ